MSQITLGSLFAGSGSFELAGTICGVTPKWNAEIEPYPCSVLATRFPGVPNLGDVRQIDGAKIEPVDIITGGSPCTDLSIAGSREGLKGSASSLFYEMIRIIREMRVATGNKYPRFVLWENVPGALTSHKGADFHEVVKQFCGLAETQCDVPRPKKWKNFGLVVGDGWSFSWRILSAEYFGVPQRRRRIYALLDLGSERAGEILSEPEGGSWYSETCRKSWQNLTSGSGGSNQPDDLVSVRFVENHSQDSRITLGEEGEPCQTLTSWMGTGGCNVPFILEERWFFTNQSFYKYLAFKEGVDKGVAGAVIAHDAKNHRDLVVEGKQRRYRLRRLTPTECIRLQGLPKWWLDDVPGPECAKYKLAGNGIAVPCAVDIISRIVEEVSEGSL